MPVFGVAVFCKISIFSCVKIIDDMTYRKKQYNGSERSFGHKRCGGYICVFGKRVPNYVAKESGDKRQSDIESFYCFFGNHVYIYLRSGGKGLPRTHLLLGTGLSARLLFRLTMTF